MTDTDSPRAPFTMDDVQIRAAVDPRFRADLVADPKRTLADAGIHLHPEVTVRVIDQPKDELILPIPPAAPGPTEIDDDAAADVAAGTLPFVLGAAAGFGGVVGWHNRAVVGSALGTAYNWVRDQV
jgi:hypothetical protein